VRATGTKKMLTEGKGVLVVDMDPELVHLCVCGVSWLPHEEGVGVHALVGGC
jgi:hypothetical protein